MEQFKVEHFKKANPGEHFPQFNHLASAESDGLRRQLAKRFGMSPDADGLLFVTQLATLQQFIPNINADADNESGECKLQMQQTKHRSFQPIFELRPRRLENHRAEVLAAAEIVGKVGLHSVAIEV